jgi:hypothetical protein
MGFGSFFKSVLKPVNEVTRFVGGVATLGQLNDPALESAIGGAAIGAATGGVLAGPAMAGVGGGITGGVTAGATSGALIGAGAGSLLNIAGQIADMADMDLPSVTGTDSQSILTAKEEVSSAVKEQEKRIRARMQTTFAGNLFESPIILRKTLLGA